MAMDPFIGTIRAVVFNFEEQGWFFCDGRLLSISQYQALFAVIGTAYGGDGRVNFALPDLRSRALAGSTTTGQNPQGISINHGAVMGSEVVTLSTSQMPMHSHTLTRKSPTSQVKTTVVSANTGLGSIIGVNSAGKSVTIPSSDNEIPPNPPLVIDAVFSPMSITPAGGSQPHENRQPFLAFNFQIAYDGVYPPRS